jgi:hypothetical protein
MARRPFPAGLAAAVLLLSAVPASAQFIQLTRCRAALPCSQPFGLQYRPDPLIAGPYSSMPASAVSGHIELKANPKVELDKPPAPPLDDAVSNSVRYFLRKHPVPKKPEEPSEPQSADPQR